MTLQQTVLLMSRGARLHRFFREMADDLRRDFHVVVLAMEEEVASFAQLPGVEVEVYQSLDMVWDDRCARRLAARADLSLLRRRAAAIETELDLPVYKAASNYLLYGAFVRSYYGPWNYLTSETEILSAYVGAYDQLQALVTRYRPTAVFYETVDLISTYLALALAIQNGAFPFEFKFAPLTHGFMNLVVGLHRRNIMLEHLYAHPALLHQDSWSQADEFIEAYTRQPAASSYAAIHRQMVNGYHPLNIQRWVGAISTTGIGWNTVYRAERWVRMMHNRVWLGRHLQSSAPTGRYIAYSLQHAPEATTYSQIPRWANQDLVIQQLAIHAPSGLQIAVKEHPRTYGRRGPEFFEPLRQLPNVVLCHPLTDNRALLAGAEAIVALTGAVGFEGILLGKRVGVLGRPFYAISSGVRLLKYPDDIYKELADRSWDPVRDCESRRRFVAAYLQSCFPFGHGSGSELWPDRGGERWACALRATIQFAVTHQLKPTDFETGLGPL